MNYLDTYNLWKSKQLEDPDLIAEMVDIEGNDYEIKERFVKMLEFGTAGLRGILGVGTNRMNIYTVALATQGMADYINEKYKNPSVAIAYDSRIKSDLFARVTARVFAANGVKAYLFKELMPTPTLSFAVRQLHCSAGIVITASHNPAQYNGYKAYGDDGCQLNPQAAAKVLELASKTDIFDGVKKISLEQGLRSGMIEYISDELVDQYLDRVFALRVSKAPVQPSHLKVVYTPLNGTGNKLVRRILGRIGIEDIEIVREQVDRTATSRPAHTRTRRKNPPCSWASSCARASTATWCLPPTRTLTALASLSTTTANTSCRPATKSAC